MIRGAIYIEIRADGEAVVDMRAEAAEVESSAFMQRRMRRTSCGLLVYSPAPATRRPGGMRKAVERA
jgi:hypothetical protein